MPQSEEAAAWAAATAASAAAAASWYTGTGFQSTATATYTLKAGEYLPYRIFFGQMGGPVKFSFSIKAPDGTVILDSNTAESEFIVQYSCDGVTAPAFPAFGQE